MPIYDFLKTYAENIETGPVFSFESLGEFTAIQKAPRKPSLDFLGFKINTPIGVPAGPLLNSRWVSLAAQLRFDVLTYKTIRSFAHPGHPLPNIVFVERTEEKKARQIAAPCDLASLSITNSFGMPSMSPEFILEDIAKANASLQRGQVLIVSVVGTPNQGLSFFDDFVHTAQLAKTAGAQIIEANFSCPNVGKSEGILYTDPDAVFTLTKKLSDAIHPIPLLLKVGSFANKAQMKASFLAAARGNAAGICGLNSVSMEVSDHLGNPCLGENRKTSGVCGGAIRADGLRFIQDASAINREEKLGLTLLGCGGLMLPEHLAAMLQSGADIALSATGMMWDPLLALRYIRNRHTPRAQTWVFHPSGHTCATLKQ